MSMILRCTLLTILITAGATADADGPLTPDARLKTIAPFVDAQTIAVGYVDFTRIEADPLADQLAVLAAEREEDQREVGTEIKATMAAWRQAGGRDVFLVVSLADAGLLRLPAPFLIVPLYEETNPKAVATLFGENGYQWDWRYRQPRSIRFQQVVKPLGNVLFVGSRDCLARLGKTPPVARTELGEAFRAAGNLSASLLLLPSVDDRRVVEEMMPQLAAEFGGGPSRVLTRGLIWAALAVQPPPLLSLSLTIQSQDEQAARALRDEFRNVYPLLAKHEQLRRILPDFDQLAGLLTPTVRGSQLTVAFNDQDQRTAALLSAVRPAVQQARRDARRMPVVRNLRQIGLGFQNHESALRRFPAPASRDTDGKPLLSWRVRILPYIEAKRLYEQFHLDEPWDSPHNTTLIDKMPRIYRSPYSKLKGKGLTQYLMPIGEGTLFFGPKAPKWSDIHDGTSRTILVVEADEDQAVIWTKPDDLPYDPQQPARGLGGLFGEGFHAVFCDGSVYFIPLPQDPKILRTWFTSAAGDDAPDPSRRLW